MGRPGKSEEQLTEGPLKPEKLLNNPSLLWDAFFLDLGLWEDRAGRGGSFGAM